MGMYDTVLVPCPKCGTPEHFQTKSGPCGLITYELHNAPDDVLLDVNRHAPYTCRNCRTRFEVQLQVTYVSVVAESPGHD